MKKELIVLGIVFIISIVMNTKALSVVGGIHIGNGGGGNRVHVPPVPHPPQPPRFFHEWSISEVIGFFVNQGVEMVDLRTVIDSDYRPLPAKAKEGIKFRIPVNEKPLDGCILSFNVKHDLEKVRNHYLKLNKKGQLRSWTFVKDNILLVLDGRMPEKIARKYEEVLDNLKK